MEHDLYAGIALVVVLGGLIKNVGPGCSGWTEPINKDLEAEEAMLRNIRQSEINFCKNSIAMEEVNNMLRRMEQKHMLFIVLDSRNFIY